MNKGVFAVGVLAVGGLAVYALSKQTSVNDSSPNSAFQQSLIKSDPIAATVAKLSQSGMDNAAIVNNVLAAQQVQQAQAAKEAVLSSSVVNVATKTSNVVSVPGSTKTTSVGGKTFVSYFAPGTKQIANDSGKNYANLGAGTDPTKW